MKLLSSFFKQLLGFFKQLEGTYTKQYVSDLPDHIDSKTLYIAGEGKYKWFVAMKCPCGCEETIQLSLEKDSSPRWHLSEHFDGTVSLYPSIWRNKRCLSHFWIKRSTINWCAGTGKILPPIRNK